MLEKNLPGEFCPFCIVNCAVLAIMVFTHQKE